MTSTWAPPAGPAAGVADTPGVQLDRGTIVRAAIEKWSNQLIDRSGKNRLLYCKTPSRAVLELPTGSVAIDQLLAGNRVRLSTAFLGEDTQLRNACRQAEYIAKNAATAFEELGFSTLYLGLHAVSWPAQVDRSKPSAPLFLCPLEIEKKANGADFELGISAEWEVNDALLLVLETTFQMKLNPEPLIAALAVQPTRSVALDLGRAALRDLPAFTVQDKVVVSNFAYHDLPIVQDLRLGNVAYAESDLVSALAGVPAAKSSVWARNEVADQISGRPTSPTAGHGPAAFLVHDADASQEAAVRLALAGRDLVIEGPPGTGKSQTIANVIASLIGNHKSVLFVAEKRAAIDAVARYLGTAGIEDLLFDLHAGVESPKRIATAVKQALDQVGNVAAPNFAPLDGRVEQRRIQLDTRCQALHDTKQPWNTTLWSALNVLYSMPKGARIDGAPIPQAHESSLALELLPDVDEAMRTFVELGGALLVRGESPWAAAHAARTVASASRVEHVRGILQQLVSEGIPNFRLAIAQLVSQSGVVPPEELEGWGDVFALLGAVREDLTTFDTKVFDADLERLLASYTPITRGLLIRATSSLTSSEYRAARREIAALVHGSSTSPSAELHHKLAHANASKKEWMRRSQASRPSVPESAIVACRGWHDHLLGQIRELQSIVGPGHVSARTLEKLSDETAALLGDDLLDRLPALGANDDLLQRSGFGPLLAAVSADRVDATNAGMAVRWTWNRMVVRRLLAQSEISGATRETLDRAVAEFVSHDSDSVRSAPLRVRRQWAEHVHATRQRLPHQVDLLQQMALGKGGLKSSSIRKLLTEAPDLLLALRPCWTMSPLIVSKLLPQIAGLFDVVVFDEASQVKPVHALPALMRAKRAVVCGDDKQLPPTQFFDLLGDDEPLTDDEEVAGAAVTTMESVLDAVSAAVSTRASLRWHYRSRDDRLIAFCNSRRDLYDGKLVTFPGARLESPLRHILVSESTTDRTTSPRAEVDRIVALVQDHAHRTPERSLGVITFGIKHAERIEAALRDTGVTDEALDSFLEADTDEPFFVKSIERVQGDERDDIIISVGLGHNTDGRLHNRLGVINQEGGIRRLNVAFTRAKSDLTLVTSFTGAEIAGASFSSDGAMMLAAFVRYAASGGTELVGPTAVPILNAFESDIGSVLDKAGVPYRAQWGASGFSIDFALEHRSQPGRFVLAVECDGRAYHSSKSARDRDRLRQQHLERLGWRFHRIWSTEWFKARANEASALLAAYEAAVRRADLEHVEVAATAPTTSDDFAESARVTRGARPNVPMRAKIDDYRLDEIVQIVRWVQSDTRLRSREQLVRDVMPELGFSRLGPRIRAAIEAAVDSAGVKRA